MDWKQCGVIAAVGCALVVLVLVIAVPVAYFLPQRVALNRNIPELPPAVAQVVGTATPRAAAPLSPMATPAGTQEKVQAAQEPIPTMTVESGTLDITPSPQTMAEGGLQQLQPGSDLLPALYDQVMGGVVNVQVFIQRGGSQGVGAGSGFILNGQGYIVTNYHVVSDAQEVIVIFPDGQQVEAEVVGTDADSDLAVIKVPELPDGIHPLPVGDSDRVEEGQWVVAIGNPFGQQGSMTLGIISAKGRIIPSLAQAFSIPEALQTDAAINPGNSGGPLLNLQGEVIGVNAQIETGGGVAANAGVGFAIPSNIVRRVVPVLIEQGEYTWPWLGISAPQGGVNLFIQQANNLPTQRGAYIDEVLSGSPADQAGLQGTTGTEEIQGVQVPVGGDVVVAADGERIDDFADLLAQVAAHRPGDTMTLTVLRNGQEIDLTVELEARPKQIGR